MKKIVFAVLLTVAAASGFAYKPPEVSEKVLKLFQQTFRDPTEVNWKEHDGVYEVYFKQDEITNRVTYDADGNILRYTRNYSGDQLPIHILANLNRRYPDRSITAVTEFFSGGDLNYYVTMK